MVHAKPNGTSPIRTYTAKAVSVVADGGRKTKTYIDRAISPAKTKRVKKPNRTVIRLGLDFSNDKITAPAMKEVAIAAIAMKGVNDLR